LFYLIEQGCDSNQGRAGLGTNKEREMLLCFISLL